MQDCAYLFLLGGHNAVSDWCLCVVYYLPVNYLGMWQYSGTQWVITNGKTSMFTHLWDECPIFTRADLPPTSSPCFVSRSRLFSLTTPLSFLLSIPTPSPSHTSCYRPHCGCLTPLSLAGGLSALWFAACLPCLPPCPSAVANSEQPVSALSVTLTVIAWWSCFFVCLFFFYVLLSIRIPLISVMCLNSNTLC